MEEEALLKEDPNSKKAYDYLVSKGIKNHIAAGIVGNLMQESYQLDRVWEEGKLDSVGSLGIMQWHGDRLKKLYEFQKEKDPNYTNGKAISLFDQLDYILYEAETGAGSTWMKKQYDKAFNAKNSEEAALLFSKHVLRPNSKYAHNENRIKYAKSFKVDNEEAPIEFDMSIDPKYRETNLKVIDNTDVKTPDPFYKFNNNDFFGENFFTEDNTQGDLTIKEDILPELEQENITEEVINNNNNKKESYTDFIQNYLTQIDNTNQKALGGKITSNNLEIPKLNEFNNGGTHEENPLGGIPQGIGLNGKMNTVEEGETSYDFPTGKYIFSNRIKI